ncbi:MAG: response regulator [Desulfosarcina sp.]
MYGLAVALRVSTDPGVESPVLSSLLIRSIRELLFNVTKHSGAKGASIDLRVDGNQMLVTIKDEGSGCDMETLREKRENNAAFGLFDIEDRVSFLGGSMHIESEPGEGFCVTLWVPRELSCPSDRKPPPADANRAGAFKTVVQPLEPVDPGAGRSISVLLADDHPIMREGLAELINGHAGMAVVGLAANGQEAVDLAAKLRPDVVLMDVSMPLMNGIEAARQISLLLPGIRIIGLTMHKDPDIRQAMRNAGACACLSKADDLKKLIETLSQAYNKF